MTTDQPWLAKLAAWTHDPAEKALVLMRDPAGHEGGTVRALRTILFPQGLPADLRAATKRADHWAAAADRPQFPLGESDGRYAAWTQVRFDKEPVLIHPLSGEKLNLHGDALANIDPAQIRAVSEQHFEALVIAGDTKRTALNLWRFGPSVAAPEIRSLWKLLPADTRVPDHTIWTHLDLSSAFATAFVADPGGDAALLSVSFGPVQDFIAAARTTSDLWAGSHLLSRIAWEGLKVIAGDIGPDAVLFPQLRGIPQVDLWLRDEMGLPAENFADLEWVSEKTDANPLFAATLPNKFVAIVPSAQAAELAKKVTVAMRGFVERTAGAMLAELLEKSGLAHDKDSPCHSQLRSQLAGFPEVHWAAVPFSLIAATPEGKASPEQTALVTASSAFMAADSSFLDSPAWKLLSKEITVDGSRFYEPNPGVLYPAIYDLLDRVAAAAKATRPFAPATNEGYRCDLTGEAEWLTTDRAQLQWGRQGRRDAETLWNGAAKALPGLFRKGEHLCALAMLKRLWPRHFVVEVNKSLGLQLQRYVVSTHTLALATSLEAWIDRDGGRAAPPRWLEQARTTTALPHRLMRRLIGKSDATRQLAKSLPSWLDEDDEESSAEARRQELADLLGQKPEAYYAFILMDGDRMGAWLSGSEAEFNLPFGATWHPSIQASIKGRFPAVEGYLNARRTVSPARHMAISAALNDFALHLARHVVEDLCKGKLIYAGGDDVLAMVSVDDLLRCLTLLRLAYSGIWPEQPGLAELLGVAGEPGMARLKRGHARLDGQLLRLMGQKATTSAGAVVAHHTAPLGGVLRELRKAEKRAKTEGGRDAFAITLQKRSGGAVELTCPWLAPSAATDGHTPWESALKGSLTDTPMALLIRLRQRFAGDTSRRAAYLTQGWLEDLPTVEQAGVEILRQLLAANLGQQLRRQGGPEGAPLGYLLADIACSLGSRRQPDRRDTLKSPPAALVRDLLAVAEFLAREGRSTGEPA